MTDSTRDMISKPILRFTLAALLMTNQAAGFAESGGHYTSADLDMSQVRNITEKKQRFFDFLRPIVMAENQRIRIQRQTILDARQRRQPEAVADIARAYHVAWPVTRPDWERLLERVDTVPLELALAQAANESAWGQSRFAREGNNFFGQWCYKKGCGLVPKRRNPGSTHEVAAFPDVNTSVRAYLKNINTGRVYAPLRKLRADARKAGKTPGARQLAAGLIKYSERREAYVREIRAMIRVNRKLMRGNTASPTDTDDRQCAPPC